MILSCTLIIMATLKPVGFDNDSVNYENALTSFQDGSSSISEPTFIVFSWLDGVFFDSKIHGLFFMYAFISILINMFAIYKYSEVRLFSLIVYVCLYFVLHNLTQIRVGAAAAMFLLAIPDLISKNKTRYILKILLACMFHFSSIILIPLVFLNNNRLNAKLFVAAPFTVLCFILIAGDMYSLLISIFSLFPAPIGPKAVNYILNLQLYGRFDNVNIFSKITLCTLFFFLIYAISLIRKSTPNESDVIYFKLMSIMLTVFYLLSSVPVLASRSFELLGISLIFSLPTLSLKFKQKKLAGLVIILWCFLYFYIVNLKLLNFEMLGLF
ncbi:EpsG family protein [Erwinia aphidicola]|uniref:EpsG family protein n=2 Tax=Erwinia aphidicola TaxID=68334 RepID=UPI0030D201A0